VNLPEFDEGKSRYVKELRRCEGCRCAKCCNNVMLAPERVLAEPIGVASAALIGGGELERPL
jgi:hypothetical protein